MTSIDFLNKVHKSLDSQEYNLSYSPAKSKNYMLYCNGNFIGGLFDEELCFVYADSVSELLGQPEPFRHLHEGGQSRTDVRGHSRYPRTSLLQPSGTLRICGLGMAYPVSRRGISCACQHLPRVA